MTITAKRIMIVGSGGAGKSTLAAILSDKLNLPLIHLDTHYWTPGWIESEEATWRTKVETLLEQDEWIMDGNFSSTFDLRLPRTELVIDLSFSRWICLFRIFKRIAKYYGRTRPDLPEGCPERFDWEFLKWVWNYPEKSRPKIVEAIKSHSQIEYLAFSKPADLNRWLNSLALCG